VSLPPLDLTLPTDHLHITPLHDPVVDLLGHDLRSTYVERFWLPILGPSSAWRRQKPYGGVGGDEADQTSGGLHTDQHRPGRDLGGS